MGQTGKPNGGPQASGTSDTLARIARLISIGDEPEPANDTGPDADDAPPADETAPPASFTELTSGQLLEALPAGLAICLGEKLVNANSAFALAFGYPSVSELEKAGGFSAIFPDGLQTAGKQPGGAGNNPSRSVQIRARTRSGRTFRVPVAVHAIPAETDERASLIVLHPDGTIFTEQDQIAKQPERPVTAETALNEGGGHGGGDAPKKKKKRKKGAKKKSGNQAAGGDLGRTDFLVKVSHELRTPLNSIIGFAEIMKDEQLGPIGNDRYRGYIRDILDSGVYALSLINDLLDISKIESGEFELNFTAVDLDEVISESVHSMQPQAQRRRVLLRTSFAEGLPPVLADRRSIRQIILNLVSNAIKFTKPGGQVIVSTQATGSGGVRIRVRDTGIGMSRSEIEVALKPYKQIDSTPPGEPGTGLGLPLTKALVEANRARFKVRSVSKAGTRIDVTFPKDRVAEPRD